MFQNIYIIYKVVVFVIMVIMILLLIIVFLVISIYLKLYGYEIQNFIYININLNYVLNRFLKKINIYIFFMVSFMNFV